MSCDQYVKSQTFGKLYRHMPASCQRACCEANTQLSPFSSVHQHSLSLLRLFNETIKIPIPSVNGLNSVSPSLFSRIQQPLYGKYCVCVCVCIYLWLCADSVNFGRGCWSNLTLVECACVVGPNDEIPLCIRSRKRASPWSKNYPPPAIDEFLRNWIKFPVWVSDIYRAEILEYCVQYPFSVGRK
ncbi:hypothetical protein T4A_2520 [Trichinella pseudospiralis]|uniref:Uncharacterized protein n=1 Tax=Trichinella pseudospiralis TaxID=6337 RepID=A0A0V1E5E2_TRIPS|nr:hypothetical protein T4A_2520 [Trichinella pseudospiralis]